VRRAENETAKTAKTAKTTKATKPDRATRPDSSALAALGLERGEAVRFRRPDRARWQAGTVQGLERDGSIGLTDSNGAARAVLLAHVQVRARSRRAMGRTTRWEPLADRAARTEQLRLL
jgi:hypothetical protein